MANPFDTPSMAEGYATRRPAVHPHVIERVHRALGGRRFAVALDVGCGAGLSTAALRRLAGCSIGLDPAVSMLRWGALTAPDARFAAAAAEALPLREASVDLIAAAGSLNYAVLHRFFPEAARVLRPAGVLVVYDFSPGRWLRESSALEQWFAEFERRYPPPAGEALEITPEFLAALECGFHVTAQEPFEIGLPLSPEFYLEYVLTETNVAAAVRNGASPGKIRRWCEDSLAPVFAGREREVLFRGYFACMSGNGAQ